MAQRCAEADASKAAPAQQARVASGGRFSKVIPQFSGKASSSAMGVRSPAWLKLSQRPAAFRKLWRRPFCNRRWAGSPASSPGA